MLWLTKDATYELFVVLETSYLTGASRSFLRAPHQLPNNMYDEVLYYCSHLPSIPLTKLFWTRGSTENMGNAWTERDRMTNKGGGDASARLLPRPKRHVGYQMLHESASNRHDRYAELINMRYRSFTGSAPWVWCSLLNWLGSALSGRKSSFLSKAP